MLFFAVNRDVTGEEDGLQFQLTAPGTPGPGVSLAHVYCITPQYFAKIKQRSPEGVFRVIDESAIRDLPQCPVELGVSNRGECETAEARAQKHPPPETPDLVRQLERLGEKTSIRIALINGFGLGMGDSLVGLTALRAAHRIMAERFDGIVMDVFLRLDRFKTLLPLFAQESMIGEVLPLPMSAEKLFSYDAFYDLSGLGARPEFERMAMVDFFLHTLGVNPDQVPKDKKRNLIKLSAPVHDAVKLHLGFVRDHASGGKKLLLFHPKSSSPLRDIPEGKRAAIVRSILDKTDYTVISAAKMDFVHDRFCDVSDLSASFDHFCAIVAEADAVLTVDTVTHHVADGLGIPTVALFTTIPPEHRVQYYPLVKGILLDGAKETPYFQNDHPAQNIDLDVMARLWDRLDMDHVLDALAQMVDKKEKCRATLTCPMCQTSTTPLMADCWLDYTLYGCPACEGEFAWPMKSHDYESAYQKGKGSTFDYSHYVQEGKSRAEVIDHTVRQVRYEKVAWILRHFPNKRTHLDVGCANGALPAFTSDIGFDSYGIDAAEICIEYGRRVLGHPNLATASTLAELPDHFPRQFQVITSFELLEHLEDPNVFARQVWDHLEDGGCWFFSTPNRDRLYFRAGIRNTRKHKGHDGGDYPPDHLTRWRAKTQRMFIERNGFVLVDQFTTPLVEGTVAMSIGPLPIAGAQLPNGRLLNRDQTSMAVFQYLAPLFSLIDGYGNFLFTIAKKAKA